MWMDAGCCSTMRHHADLRLCRCHSTLRGFVSAGPWNAYNLEPSALPSASIALIMSDNLKWDGQSEEMYLKEKITRSMRGKNIEFAGYFFSGARHDQC